MSSQRRSPGTPSRPADVPGTITSHRSSSGPVSQGDRPRSELVAMHELQLDPLLQTGEQRRPVSGKDWLHEELVLVDQSQIRQGQGEGHTAHEEALAWLLLELLNRLR